MEIRTKLITDLPLSEVLGGSEIFPVNQFGVAKKASTQDIIEFTKKQEYATWVNQASTNLKTIDLSTRYLNLYNVPLNQEPFPEFFIGEAGLFSFQGEVSSLSGFKYHYNDQTDRFVFVSYSSAVSANVTNLTAYYIDSNAFMYITNLSTSNTLSARNIYVTDQITISANSNNDALFIVQNGQGNAIEVFDQSNDTTPFVVTASGNVGIKTPNPLIDLTIFGNVSSSATLSGRNVHVMERLGVATARPNETLTVLGNISASGVIFDRRLNSDRWFETFTNYSAGSANEAQVATFVNANSANIRNVNTKVNTTSANWDSVYSHMQANTGSIYATRTYVGNNSANFSDSVSRYNNLSATYAPFAYVNAGFLPLSGGEVSSGTVRISGLTTFGGDVAIVGRLSANLLTVLKTESIPITASTLNVDGSGRFGGPFQLDGQVRVNNNLTVTGFANVSSTITADGIVTSRTYLRDLNGDSRNWNSAYVRWNAVSALDLQVRNFVNPNSANIRNVNTKVNSTSSNWDQVYSAVIPSSANWNSNYSHWNSNSGLIFMTRNFVTSNSANSLNVNTKVNSTSSNWDRTYSTWSPISAITTGTTTFVSQTSSLTNRVNTYVAGTSASFILNGGNTGATTIGTNNNTNLTLETNGTAKVTITGTGNVGINQTSPTSRLHVVDSSANPAVLITQGSSGDGLRITQTGTGNALVVEDQASDTTPFIIKADGKVGIGTSTPTHSLQVNNAISFTGGDIPLLINYLEKTFIIATSAANWGTSIRLTNSDDIDAFRDSIHFYTSGTSRMYLRSDGNVGIGTTGPTQKLDVAGNIKSTGIIYDATGNSTNWNSAYSSFFNLSAAIGEGLTEFQESSARYNRVSTRVEGTSANWNSVYTTFQANSGKYNSERGVINIPLSGTTLITDIPNHTVGFMDIYLNGIKLVKPDDFSETATTITLTEPTKYNNYKLEYVVYGAYNVANAVSRTGDTMTGNLTVPNLDVTGSFTLPTIVLSRNNISLEGGEIQLARASDNLSKYYIDVNGSGSDPNLRFFERVGASTFTERVILQGATGNLGIGNSSPNAKVYIIQNHATQVGAIVEKIGGSGDALLVTNSGTGAALKITNTGSGRSFWVEDQASDTTPFVIDAGGNVGVNTTSPSANLTVAGIAQFQNAQWIGPDNNLRPVVELNENNSVYLNTPNNIFLGLSGFYQNPAPNLIPLADPYDFNGWSLTRVSREYTTSETTAPDGTTHKISKIIGTTSGTKAISEDLNFDQITPYTGSFYAKPIGNNTVLRVYLLGNGTSLPAWPNSSSYVDFRLDSATIRTIATGGGDIEASIKAAGNGWCFCSVTRTPTATGNGRFQATILTTALGTPALEPLAYFWRAKLEKGSSSTNNLPDISIQSNGNVGLGTANSTEKLTVVGNVSATGDVRITGTFYGDGGGISRTREQNKFWKFKANNNDLGDASTSHRLNSFLTKNGRLYVAGYSYYNVNGRNGVGLSPEYVYPGFHPVGRHNIPLNETIVEHYGYPDALFVKTNLGNLYGMGRNSRGELGCGYTGQVQTWAPVLNLTNVTDFSMSNRLQYYYWTNPYPHSLAIMGGRLYAWGHNNLGQLGLGTSNVRDATTSPQLVNVGALQNKTNLVHCYAAGDEGYNYGHSYVIDSNRKLFACGHNQDGRLGTGNTTQYNEFVAVAPNLNCDKICSGGWYTESTTIFLDRQLGVLYGAGYNGNSGVLGVPTTTVTRSTFAQIPNLSNVVDFAIGGHCNRTGIALLSDGTIRTWGANPRGILGHNGTTNTHIPAVPINMQGKTFQKVMVADRWWGADYSSIHALDTEGYLWGTGYNGDGRLGIGNVTSNIGIFTRAAQPDDVRFVDFRVEGFGGGTYVTAVDTYGDLWSVGYHSQHSCGTDRPSQNFAHFARCDIH